MVTNSYESEYRHEVNRLVSLCDNDNLELNASKTREMIVDFRKKKTSISPIIINGEPIESMGCFTFLGWIICCDLGLENNTDAVWKNAQQNQLSAPTYEFRAEEGDSCSIILSFCY